MESNMRTMHLQQQEFKIALQMCNCTLRALHSSRLTSAAYRRYSVASKKQRRSLVAEQFAAEHVEQVWYEHQHSAFHDVVFPITQATTYLSLLSGAPYRICREEINRQLDDAIYNQDLDLDALPVGLTPLEPLLLAGLDVFDYAREVQRLNFLRFYRRHCSKSQVSVLPSPATHHKGGPLETGENVCKAAFGSRRT